MIEQRYILDLTPQGIVTVVHVSQYDAGSRTLTFELQKDGVPYTPPSRLTAYISGRKPDNTVFYYQMTVGTRNEVSIVLKNQMTLVAGEVMCKIILSASGEQIGTSSFTMMVERTPTAGGSISQTDIPIFEQILNEALEAVGDAKQAATRAETAAASVDAIPVPDVVQIWTETDPAE
jgi:hypothetical protein